MTKKITQPDCNNEESAFDIIELAIDDIETLTRAFTVINRICQELDAQEAEEESAGIPETLLN